MSQDNHQQENGLQPVEPPVGESVTPVPVPAVEPEKSFAPLDAIKNIKTEDIKKGWSSFLGSVKGAAANVRERALKATASGVLCADCGAELGLLKPNYAEHLPEPHRQQKPGLCGDCVQKYTITCFLCETVWQVDPDRRILGCPKCTGITCSDCGNELGRRRNCASLLPREFNLGKVAVCPDCAAKYTIHCDACDHDWSINDGGGVLSCPKCSGMICFDCNIATDKRNNVAVLLPEEIRNGKASLCPNCAGKYAIPCTKCGFDWRLHVEKGIITCPLCGLSEAVGCSDITHALHQSKAFLSRIPGMSSEQDFLDNMLVVGAIYRRGHPHYLDPMGGFLVLTQTGCYFLGPIDPDSPEMGYRDISMPFSSISAVSALAEGVHTNTAAFYQGLTKKAATVVGLASGLGALLLTGPMGMLYGGVAGKAAEMGLKTAVSGPPPKNRLTIGYKEMNRVTVVFDLMDISKEKIEATAIDFRKRLMKFSGEFGLGKKTEPKSSPESTDKAETFRVFQQGKLLGLFEDSTIRTKIERQEFRTNDFVLVPLETFLNEIKIDDLGFQYYRDGKRIDQYTLPQIRQLHESGQTQPIDHVLLPMQVFLDRNRPTDEKVKEEPNADIYGIQ